MTVRTKTDLAIQIVNYNTKSYLQRCLEGVIADLEGTETSYVVLVLDNDSGEDLSDIRANFPEVELHVARKNLGYGAGHNLLAAKHSADRLLLLNPDIKLVEPQTIDRLQARLEGDVKIVGPMLTNELGKPQRWDHGELVGIRASLAARAGHGYWRLATTRREAAWVSGAVLLIDAQAFLETGKFDEQFFMFKEEEDLALRVRQRGWRVVYDPTVKVVHYGRASGASAAVRSRSERIYIDKHARGRRGYLLFRYLNRLLSGGQFMSL